MGLRTLKEMEDELVLRLGNRSDIPEPRLRSWVNSAYMEISTRYIFHELHELAVATVGPNVDFFTLPLDIHSIFSVRDSTNNVKLRPTSWRQVDSNGAVVYSQPESYARFGNAALIWPGTEDQIVIQLRYLRRVDPLANLTDVALTPSEWDEVIEQGALWRGLRAILEPERAEAERMEHLRLINSMPLFDQIEDIDYGTENTIGVRFRA